LAITDDLGSSGTLFSLFLGWHLFEDSKMERAKSLLLKSNGNNNNLVTSADVYETEDSISLLECITWYISQITDEVVFGESIFCFLLFSASASPIQDLFGHLQYHFSLPHPRLNYRRLNYVNDLSYGLLVGSVGIHNNYFHPGRDYKWKVGQATLHSA
jgi:hypothetical protein